MKKKYVLGILFFSSLWGISEALLGEALYSANIPYASVPLATIGFSILAVAWVFLPRRGIATCIAAMAMLYKFLNIPFFACHLLGILIMGICFDFFFNTFKLRNHSIEAAAAAYLNYALFAFMITYIFQYEHWVQGGLTKVLSYIAINGSMTAVACAVLVPAAVCLAKKIRGGFAQSLSQRLQLVPGGIIGVTAGLWFFGMAVYIW